ncbi:MAG TPA: hypothetical protein VHO24_04495, partial [Opitutaceae bacterium]|nr:hypothetical protein [Opitutaceae bacterium]
MTEKPKGPGALYFDSNILRKAGWPEPSARLLEVVNKATAVGVIPAIVDLVQRELREAWVRDVVRDRNSLVGKGKEFSKRTFKLVEIQEPPRLPSLAEMRSHYDKVAEKFAQRFRPVPTTSRPTTHFMDLALSRGGA